MSTVEIEISINPLCEEIISDFLINELKSEGVILKETYYEDEKIISETQGIIKAFFDKLPENLEKKLQERKSFLKDAGIDEANLGKWSIENIIKIEDENWAHNWKKYWDVQKIGEKTIICPSWLECTPKDNEIKIELDPGSAFGTGTHPTTRLCIKALEKYVNKNTTVADVGTGSGILAIASKMYGASTVVGVDNDASVIQVAKDNAEHNGISDITFYEGSASDIDQKFDIVAANILANVIVSIMDDLAKLCLNSSKLILSGIMTDQNERVINSLKQHNFEVSEILSEENWSAIIAQPSQK